MTWNNIYNLQTWTELQILETWSIVNKIAPNIQKAIQSPASIFTTTVITYIIIFFWTLCIIWVFKDIKNRTQNVFLQILSVLLITFLTPIVWLPIYIAIRPINNYKDRLYRKEALDINTTTCENCDMINKSEYKYCFNCWHKIHHKCTNCDNTFSYEYSHCPDCGKNKNSKTTHK